MNVDAYYHVFDVKSNPVNSFEWMDFDTFWHVFFLIFWIHVQSSKIKEIYFMIFDEIKSNKRIKVSNLIRNGVRRKMLKIGVKKILFWFG
jgi:hypothetical protein